MDMDTTESVMLSQRLMLIPTFCMVDTTDTVLDTMDMVLDMDMDTMESVRPNQRLMLMLTCTVDIMVLEDTVDMVDIMDSAMREAEPKADADAYLYRGYYGLGGYRGYGGYFGHRYYGKRSADAEPKADPYLLYGGYGHLGYAGHYGYPYAAYSYYG